MAITLSNFDKQVAGAKRRHQVTAAIASYTSAGETVSASQLGLQVVDGVSPILSTGRNVDYTGGKIVVYDSGGTEVTAGQTFTVRLEFIGR